MCTPEVDSKVLDGAAAIQMLSLKLTKTFQHDVDRQFESVKRGGIVWDMYKNDDPKLSTIERRGCGSSRMVLPSIQLPGDWKGFLRDNDNKMNLFQFIAKYLSEKQFDAGKQLVTTIGDQVQCCQCNTKDSL
jgi:hypothetical protein